MPYTLANPPEIIKELPNNAQRIFISAFNDAYNQTNSEKSAHRIAWAAVRKKYEKINGAWRVKNGL